MKRFLKVLLILFFSLAFIDNINALTYDVYPGNSQVSDIDYEKAKEMVKEVMSAYYFKGPAWQYSYSRAKYSSTLVEKPDTPEEATSQDTKYTVCAGFTGNVYKETFGMLISDTDKSYFPVYNSSQITRARNYYNSEDRDNEPLDGNFLIYYEKPSESKKYIYNKTGDVSVSDFAQLIQPGDILTYTGHAMIAYDKFQKEDGSWDVVILNSEASAAIRSPIKNTANPTSLQYDKFINSKGDTIFGSKNPVVDYEGTIKYRYLSELDEFIDNGKISCGKVECIVIKPFFENELTGKAAFNYKTDDTYVKKTTLRTNEFPGITIEKTVVKSNNNDKYSKGDNNSVNIGDTLRYQIVIKNNSGNRDKSTNDDRKAYGTFYVKETIDNEYVDYVSANSDGIYSADTSTILWEIPAINPGAQKTLYYDVIVKEIYNNIGKTINSSSGRVYSTDENVYISTGTVENKIVPKISGLKDTYSSCYNTYSNSKTGLDLINSVVECATGKNLKLNEFSFDKIIEKRPKYRSNETIEPEREGQDSFIYTSPGQSDVIYLKLPGCYVCSTDETIMKWGNSEAEDDSCKKGYYITDRSQSECGNRHDEVDDNNSDYFKMILNNYWSSTMIFKVNEKVGIDLSRWLNNNEKYKNKNRNKTINSKDFREGDVLIYSQDSEICNNYGARCTSEDGIYAFIYIDGKFVGNNLPDISNTDTRRNEFTYNFYTDQSIYNFNLENTFYSKYTTLENLYENNEDGLKKELEFINYQTLFGKDYYVIMRPEMVIQEVVNMELDITNLNKTTYIQNYEDLDLTGGVLNVAYNDGTTSEIGLTSEGVTTSGFDNTTVGTKTITVSYSGLTTTFEVEVVPPQMESISVTTLPTTEYELGAQELDLTGGILTITYNNNTTTTIALASEGITVSGFDGSTAGTQTITVEYSELTTTFEVTVNRVVLDIPEVSIDTDGTVTWTNVEGATSYEVSFDNVAYVAGVSGNVTIPLTSSGEVTAYVKGIPDGNHITTSNAYGSASVNVYSLEVTGDTGIDSATGTGNYVSGKEVTISATLNNGYTFTGWTTISGNTPTNVNLLTTTVTLTQNTTLQAATEVTPKEAGHVTLDSTEGSITYGESSKTFNITSTHGGEITVTDNNDTAITLIDGDTIIVSNLDTINANNVITVIVTSAETSEYTEANATYTLTVTKAMLDMPEVSIDTNGTVTWNDVEGAASYEVSFDNTTYEVSVSGEVTIPFETTGQVTVYVKALPDGNHITSSNSYGSASVNVYSLMIMGDTGIDSATGTGNYVSGKEVTINATLNNGYTFTGWSVIDGNTPVDINSLTTTVTITEDTLINATSSQIIVEPVFNLPNMTVDTNNNVFNKIESQTYLSELFNTTDNNNTVEIYSRWDILLYSKDVASNTYISTGQYVTYLNENGERVRYDIVVPGDTDGNGIISYMDYVKVYNHIKKTKHPELTNKSLLEGDYLLAGDMYSDNKISYLDYVRIYNKIKELKENNQL